MWHKKFDPDEVPEYIEGKEYSAKELDMMAELLLREDARKELCRECGETGEDTKEFKIVDQVDQEDNPIVDESGSQLRIKFPQYKCSNGHIWFKGEGKAKGTRGENPILFEEHIIQRNRRRILSNSGEVDPSITRGLYWRAHPSGRVINTPDERKRRGLGYYR